MSAMIPFILFRSVLLKKRSVYSSGCWVVLTDDLLLAIDVGVQQADDLFLLLAFCIHLSSDNASSPSQVDPIWTSVA